MKKILLGVILASLLTVPALAADPKSDALASLTTAQNLIKQGDIKKAVDEINFALSKLNEVTASGMIGFIPPAPAGYKLVSKSSHGMGQDAMAVGNAGAEASYSGPNDASVKLTILTGGVSGKMGSFASLATLFGGSQKGDGGGSTTIRIQGFTGTLEFDATNKSGSLTMQVGEKTTVKVDASNVDSDAVIKSFVEKMDLNKLATSI